MKWLIYFFYVIFSTSALKVFSDGELIEWTVDLRIKRDSDGTFCSRIEAYLQRDHESFSDEDIEQFDDLAYTLSTISSTFKTERVNGVLLGFTVTNHPFFQRIFPVRVEVGKRYKVQWPVQYFKSNDIYRLSLVCVWPQNIPLDVSDYAQVWSTMKRRWLAVSEPFKIYAGQRGEHVHPIPNARIFDISPSDYYELEDNYECPISSERMKEPIRTETNHVFEWESFKTLIENHEKSEQKDNILLCPISRKSVDFIWCDEAFRAKALKFSEDLVREIGANKQWCFADEEAARFNLETERVNSLLKFNPLGDMLWIRQEGISELEKSIRAVKRERFNFKLNIFVDYFVKFALLGYLIYLIVYVSLTNNDLMAFIYGIFIVIIGSINLILLYQSILRIKNGFYSDRFSTFRQKLERLDSDYRKLERVTNLLVNEERISRILFAKLPSKFGYPCNDDTVVKYETDTQVVPEHHTIELPDLENDQVEENAEARIHFDIESQSK